ncbi:glycosyl transferase family 1 [Candidatus Saccharibacteria bacterium]|nr:MAG: glycosyl transferase family 1 [Candidatus Saccharibacteria bacterium]PID99156.1 MAG: glycosyl transferase family 1 [Candidatus Saccharibacteria bacterium]
MTKKPQSSLRVAIVHDWLVGGGAELVVEQLHTLFPEAPIYTSYATEEWRRRLGGKVVTGWLQPLGALRKYLPFLRIWYFTHLKLQDYDLVISSSGAEAKGIRVPKTTLHINYCHAPTHYYWSRYEEYMKRPGFGVFDPLARFGLWLLVKPLRRWDLRAAQRPDYMIANSTHTQHEIEKYYGRKSSVIFPPVHVARFQQRRSGARKGLLISGRQTPYKRFDLAVVACTKLGLPLTVIGDGPDNARLKRLSGKSVTFLGMVSDEILAEELARAEGFIFPGIDDFGIMAVEAMAAGTPVLAYKAGGALDYIKPGVTGSFFGAQTLKSLASALKQFNPKGYSSAAIRAYAQKFSEVRFQQEMQKYLTQCRKKASTK